MIGNLKIARGNSTVLVLTVCAFLTSCPDDMAVWVVEGSTVTQLEFAVGREMGDERSVKFHGMGVTSCDSGIGVTNDLWGILATNDVDTYPSRVVYGDRPDGFELLNPPAELVPGCYVISILGKQSRFIVHDDGRVTANDARSGGR